MTSIELNFAHVDFASTEPDVSEEGELERGLEEALALRHLQREPLHPRAVEDNGQSLGEDDGDGDEERRVE